MHFEHRGTEAEPGLIDRVWQTRTDSASIMTSAARTSFHLIVARTAGRLTAGLRGPETRATVADVPADSVFLGVRFSIGTTLRPYVPSSMLDGYIPLPVTATGALILGGETFEAPTFDNVEQFVGRLKGAGLLVPSDVAAEFRPGRGMSERTRQRHFRTLTGMSRNSAVQIDRANAAATRLRAGEGWGSVASSLDYFDQAHLGHALRRFVGRSIGELQSGDPEPLSFLYKTDPAFGS